MTDPSLDLFAWQKNGRPESDAAGKPADPDGRRKSAPPPRLFTVTQVNNLARNKLERDLGVVSVKGEISNYKKVASGHHYFSLKDRTAQLPAALFKREASRMNLRLRDGLEVIASGRLTIYGKAGRYQIVAERIEPLGAGALQAAFEDLKRRLDHEGLFATARKRALPRVPTRVGVVTSPTGAVIRDVVNVATRRYPGARILLIPTAVQGADAANSIAGAIGRATALAQRLGLDVLIVARGGGSLEDLWGFNEEVVARAIAAAPIPVVSGVGHETDFTISDFVADRRAATPSAAAELVFPVRSELVGEVRRNLERASKSLHRRIEIERHGMRATRARLGDGRRLVRDPRQRLIDAQVAGHRVVRDRLFRARLRLEGAQTLLAARHPRIRVTVVRGRIGASVQRLHALIERDIGNARRRLVGAVELGPCVRRQLEKQRGRLTGVGQRLDALSPLHVLQRGYAIVRDDGGNVVTDAAATEVGARLDIRLAHGRLGVRVDEATTAVADDGSDNSAQ